MNIQQMMRQAQMMQQKLQKAQAELAERTAEGSAGGGMVIVKANGKNEILSVKIKPEAIAGGADAEMLEEMVLAATNQALKTIQTEAAETMKQITGGLQLPGLF